MCFDSATVASQSFKNKSLRSKLTPNAFVTVKSKNFKQTFECLQNLLLF